MVHILELLRYGRLFTNDRSLSSIDRMFVNKRPDVFFNQPDDFKKHQGVCEKHRDHFINCLRERCLTHKGAMANAQGGDSLHLRERKPSLP